MCVGVGMYECMSRVKGWRVEDINPRVKDLFSKHRNSPSHYKSFSVSSSLSSLHFGLKGLKFREQESWYGVVDDVFRGPSGYTMEGLGKTTTIVGDSQFPT